MNRIVPSGFLLKSEERKQEIYNNIIKAGYTFEFEPNGVAIMKDNEIMYTFHTWVPEAPIISKLIWFSCYEDYLSVHGDKISETYPGGIF